MNWRRIDLFVGIGVCGLGLALIFLMGGDVVAMGAGLYCLGIGAYVVIDRATRPVE